MTDNTSPLVQPTTDHALEPAVPKPELPAAEPNILLEYNNKSAEDRISVPKKDYALITGASSGLGLTFARILASKKKPLILIGKDEHKLKQISHELKDKEGIDVRFLPIDLARSKDLPSLPGKLKLMGLKVDILINNAGFGKHGTEIQIRYEDALNMINLNCRATLAMTKLFLPGLLKQKKGAIINIADTSGFIPVPKMAAYAATKAFIINYTEALAQEVAGLGIKVLCVCPSPMSTSFFSKADINTSAHQHLQQLTDPESVVEQALTALKTGKTLIVAGQPSFWMKMAPTLMTRSWLRKIGFSLFKD